MDEKLQKVGFDEMEATVKEYISKLDELRRDGTEKVRSSIQEIRRLKVKKNISKETKDKKIAEYTKAIEEAKVVVEQNKEQIASIVKEACEYVNTNYAPIYKEAKEKAKALKAEAKKEYLQQKESIKADLQKQLEQLQAEESDEKKLAAKKKIIVRESKQQDFENTKLYHERVQKIKDEQHGCYLQRDEWLYTIRDGKRPVDVVVKNYVENYIYQFDYKKFLMKNGLYIIIALFMIVCICIKPNILSFNNIVNNILGNFSTRVFLVLGVAGLILLAGTDLSVGRMVGMSSVLTGLFLTPDTNFFGLNFSGVANSIGVAGAAILALLISIVFCVAFSALAGLFTAKFKIHPFISTLGTSLVIIGLFKYASNNGQSSVVSSPATIIAQSINGQFPITLIYAVVAIAIVWFIWNKTTFGKNMYAVGGNPEAASVSGISVFKVTMGVFIMAGVLYGLGSFLQTMKDGTVQAVYGQGWELEAIAACVIGGVSFTGGTGKISGAVLGCLILEVLKNFIGIISGFNNDISNIFIGIIILAAVTFDSIKYLKKK